MKLYAIDNECMTDFLAMYCEGKSNMWNAFLVLSHGLVRVE